MTIVESLSTGSIVKEATIRDWIQKVSLPLTEASPWWHGCLKSKGLTGTSEGNSKVFTKQNNDQQPTLRIGR